MTYTPYYFRGQGKLYCRLTTETNDKLRFMGNVPELMLGTNQQKQAHQESYTGDRRTDLRMTTATTVTMQFTMEDVMKENWQVALKASAAAQAGATVTNESHTAPAVGGYFALAKKNITALTSLTSDPAGTTYTAGTAYVASPPSNVIYVPSGSTMAGAAILANYTCGAADVIGAFNATDADLYFYFDGLNTVDGNAPVVIEMFKANLDSASQVALISDNLVNLQVSGELLYDTSNDTTGADFGGYFKVTQTQ